jgi:hypothetical protein
VWTWWRVSWTPGHPLSTPRRQSNCPLVLLLRNTMLLAQADMDRQALGFVQRYAAIEMAASNAEALRADVAARNALHSAWR